ncbi:MAG: pilus assembly protein N-terminal domain-containing protein [Terracidiphilus sp.]
MRVKPGISIAWFCALSLAVCAGPLLQAQAAAPLSQPTRVSSEDSANELSVAVGKSVLIDFARPVTRVAIGLGEYAQATAMSPTEILISGKAPGETSLIAWDTTGGRQFFNVTVRPTAKVSNDGLEAIRRELRIELPGQILKVSAENGVIFLRGTVKNLNNSDRAVQIASTAGKVVNLLNVDVPPSEPQILLKVRFASVDRSKSKQLGINMFNNGLGNALSSISTGQFTPPLTDSSGTTISSDQNIMAAFPGLANVGATIQALETKGVVEVLAEPNLLATNGKQASILAGGEYPYPVVQGGAGSSGPTITIMFKEYGVRLNFIPTITPRGTIRLQVAPEVSSLDFTNAVEVSGFDVPAISTRKVKTEVELKDGQSFVLGGLLDNRETETLEKIPFIGDIPFIGKLFQSISKNKTNTELIVIVTPEIVAPIEAGTALPELKYPEKFLPPNSGIPMNNPDAKTAANTLPPSPPTIPVEKLIESMKPETPLVIEGAKEGFGAASTGATTPGAAPASPSQ